MPATTEQDLSLVVALLSHGAGVHAMAQVATCGATVLMPGDTFDCESAWALVKRHRVSNLFIVPTILARMVRHEAVDRFNHETLRYVAYAGSPMYRADQELALARYKWPKRVEIWDALPKSTNRKILKTAIRRMLAERETTDMETKT